MMKPLLKEKILFGEPLDMPTRRFVRRMQRETGGDEEDWDDPT